ncbi:MAG TPA: hypothetical protein DDY88_08405 [Actinobacteria bacterium]|nr:hypothetical protein [Actinomycetota bacterium]
MTALLLRVIADASVLGSDRMICSPDDPPTRTRQNGTEQVVSTSGLSTESCEFPISEVDEV